MIDLIERIEAAGGPDRDLDWRIQKALGIGDWPDIDMWPPFMPGSKFEKAIPAYTASLDAAMTLVPTEPFPEMRPGKWWWGVDSLGCDAHVAYENRDSGIPEYSAQGATPALALCAAALRARMAMADAP